MPSSIRDLDGYDAPQIAWERVQEVMSTDVTHAPGTGGPSRHTSWLSTIGADGMHGRTLRSDEVRPVSRQG